MLFCRVLGPLVVEYDGEPVALGGRLQRRLMAALLAGEGRSVEDAVLTELVWGVEPGDPNALRVVVSRTRAGLGSGMRDVVRRTPGGYLLEVPVAQTDHGQFGALVAQGVRLVGEGDAAAAVEAFEIGLELWRGEPWAELGDSALVAGAVERLRELHEVAVEELAAARLALGQTSAAVAALSEAAVAAPFRERRWELLALGLYRSGRQEQALAELRRVRSLLGRELGVEPGPALRLMEQRVLAQDPGLCWVAPGEASVPVRQDPPVVTPVLTPESSFIGRGSELAALGEQLADRRLVSVVGPAGVGKTRLALEYLAGHRDGVEVWLARLAEAADGDAVAGVVAQAVGVQLRSPDRVGEIGSALAGRPGILVLDNCEHVVEAAADVALALLNACPELRVLATGRSPLWVSGEQVLTVEPLGLTEIGEEPGDAVRLLLDRVNARRLGWSPSPAERDAALRICTLLDGLPLAIELAAARERAFGLEALAEHLADGVRVLGASPRGSLSPHRSLEAAIGWSVEQLAANDRDLLLRLWPFEGGFGRQAVEAVAPGPSGLAGLAALVDRSVIAREVDDGLVRYRMLQTVRQYCQDIDPDPSATREAHSAWMRALVAEHTSALEADGAAQAIVRLRAELANIRAGIAHDLEHQPIAALRTVSQLELAWVLLGIQHEGIRLITSALDACPDAAVEDRVAGLLALSFGYSHGGEPEEATRLAESVLELLGQPSDARQAALYARAIHFRGAALMDLGDVARARDAVRIDLGPLAALGLPLPPHTPALYLLGQGMLQTMEEDPSASETLQAAHEAAVSCGSMWVEGLADWTRALGLLSRAQARPELATDALMLLRRAFEVFQRQANLCDTLTALYHSADALALLGETDTATELLASVLRHAARTGTNPRRYAHLAGAASAQRMTDLLALAEKHDRPAPADAGWDQMLRLFTTAADRAGTLTAPVTR